MTLYMWKNLRQEKQRQKKRNPDWKKKTSNMFLHCLTERAPWRTMATNTIQQGTYEEWHRHLLFYRTITRIQKVGNQLSFIHWCRLTETVWNVWIIWGYKWHCCCLETGRPVQLLHNGNQQPLDDQLVTTTSFNHSLNVKKKITAIYWELTICPSCEKEGAITTNWMENVIGSMQIINKQLSASCGAKQHAAHLAVHEAEMMLPRLYVEISIHFFSEIWNWNQLYLLLIWWRKKYFFIQSNIIWGSSFSQKTHGLQK